MAEKERIAVFDFDGTLTTKDTFIQFAIFACGWCRTIFTFLIYLPVIILMKFGICDNGRVKQHVFSSLFKGMRHDKIKQLGKDFSNQIDTFTNNRIIEMLLKHQQKGDSVVVVTASIEEWVRPWCIKNNIQHVIATKIVVKGDKLTGLFSTPNCYGPEKVTRLKEEFGDLSNYHITVYGDSRGDRELMEIANIAHKVNIMTL